MNLCYSWTFRKIDLSSLKSENSVSEDIKMYCAVESSSPEQIWNFSEAAFKSITYRDIFSGALFDYQILLCILLLLEKQKTEFSSLHDLPQACLWEMAEVLDVR